MLDQESILELWNVLARFITLDWNHQCYYLVAPVWWPWDTTCICVPNTQGSLAYGLRSTKPRVLYTLTTDLITFTCAIAFNQRNPNWLCFFLYNYSAGRTRRQLNNVALCSYHIPPCAPNRWQYDCKFSGIVKCVLDQRRMSVRCNPHNTSIYSFITCCSITCHWIELFIKQSWNMNFTHYTNVFRHWFLALWKIRNGVKKILNFYETTVLSR